MESMNTTVKYTRQSVIDEMREAQNQKENIGNWDKEAIKPYDKIIRASLRKLKNNAPKLQPGGTYTVEEISDALAWSSKRSAQKKWMKDNEDGYYSYSIGKSISSEDVEKVTTIIGYVGVESIYNYLNKNYNPYDMEIEKVGEDKEKSKSNNIYDVMCAKTITHFKGSFKLKLTYNGEPMTIIREWSSDTTLSQSDVRAFM